ncbi:MAG: VWA domain-containing protein [Blastocatellia bacterium]
MKSKALVAVILAWSTIGFAQSNPQGPAQDQPIRITTELVQLDVVVTDKKGQIVTGLKKEDFELHENGKKQLISFFESVEAGKKRKPGDIEKPGEPEVSPQGAGVADIRRIFAFVVDDLTTRFEDMVYVRQMLTNFVDNQMLPTDLVAIVRTVGGKGLLQQFTTDKALLRSAIEALTPKSHPFSTFNNPATPRTPRIPEAAGAGAPVGGDTGVIGAFDISTGEAADINSPLEDTNKAFRAYMSLGTASFVIDSMKQLPGRKSLVLISGGLPVFGSRPGSESTSITYFLNVLSDNATRAGVAIHTMDIRGLEAYRAVSSFEDTPARGMVDTGTAGNAGGAGSFGRTADQSLLGNNPIESHQGLRMLSAATGGIAVLNKNNFDEGLGQIVSANDGYYLLAYTPENAKFDNKFRKVEIKVKRDGMKVYNRRGYYAREDRPDAAPATKRDEILAAVKSPLARRDISLDAMVLYKAAPPSQGTIDVHMVIDPKKLQFDVVDAKQETNFDVVGFVFDELGKLRGGFSETVTASLTPEEFKRVSAGGLPYSANTTLPAGTYQLRLAVRDNKSNQIGTMSRYLEVPDLSTGRIAASSLLLGAVPPGEIKATNPTPILANRQIGRTQDLRYATIIYNAKLKDGKPQVRTQLIISQNGQEIYKEPEGPLTAAGNDTKQLLKWGQLGLKGVKPGRYTLTLVITDPLADKKSQTITRNMDFVVVN